ncbi:MAG: hypothetical protein EBR60_10650 [Burkholderiaceae bacterium]|nr:hypothetical protein [Burkholderiaceae bacterium]
MELIIVLAIVGIIVAFLVMQRRKDSTGESQPTKDWSTETVEPAAPYKVETPAPQVEEVAVVATPVKEVIPEAVVEVPEVVVEAAPAKKPRKARVAKPKAVVEKVVETTAKGSKRTRSKKV